MAASDPSFRHPNEFDGCPIADVRAAWHVRRMERSRVAERTAWHFRVSFLDFMLFADRRGLPNAFAPWRANEADPVRVYQTDSMGVERARILVPVLAKASERY